MRRSAYVYPWDVPRPAGALAGALRADGLDAAVVAVAYHAGKFIRPADRPPRVVFPEDGTVYFRPTLSRYGRLKPLESALTRERDVLSELAAAPDGPDVCGWAVLLHNTRLGMAAPDCCVRTAWGDPLYYSLCPSNDDAREFAAALCSDAASNYPLKGLVLETPGFLPFPHGFHHEFAQVESNAWLDALLGLCFCDSCRRRAGDAGIDAAAVAAAVRERADAWLKADADPPGGEDAPHWLLADVVGEPELAAFLRWRTGTVSSLVREIRAAVPPATEVAVIPTTARPAALCWFEGSDLRALAAAADAVETPFYRTSPGQIAADAFDVRRRMGDGTLRGILRPGPPDLLSEEDIAAAIRALAGQGVEDVSFYNYGLLRPRQRNALRRVLAATDDSPAGRPRLGRGAL